MSSTSLRVVLIGDGPTAASAYAALRANFDVVGVVRNADPDDWETDEIVRLVNDAGGVVGRAATPAALEAFLIPLSFDVVVISSYSRILPASLTRRWRFINVHYSALPEYRGRANVNWAIINGEPHTGISIHSVVPGLDAGPILSQETVPIGDRDNVTDLYAKLNAAQARLLPGAVVERHAGGVGVPQDEGNATYCCSRTADDGLIDWTRPAEEIDRLIRSLTAPFPGAFTFLGGVRVVIDRAHVLPDPPAYVGRIPGRVAAVHAPTGEVDVLAGTGTLRIERVSVEGQSRAAAEIVTSSRQTLGMSIAALMRQLGVLS